MRVDDVLRAVKNADFPARKQELVEEARRSGAPQEVVRALRGIPAERYANREEVARSVRLPADADLGHSPAQRAEQARRGGRHGQSERLREAPRPPIEEERDR